MDYRAPFSIFLAALVLVLLSSHDTAASQRHNYPQRPPAEIEHALGVLKMHDLQPQKVSVTLWSGDDAASRLENIREANRARLDPTLTHVGVNLTDPPELFDAYLQRDDLAGDPYQLRATDESGPELFDTYGYRTLYQ